MAVQPIKTADAAKYLGYRSMMKRRIEQAAVYELKAENVKQRMRIAELEAQVATLQAALDARAD